MRHFFIIIFVLLMGNSVLATEQIPDYLIYKGDTVSIFSSPLEQYFELIGKRELIDFKGCISTACWRGYYAIWELKEDSLFLKEITSCYKICGFETKNADLKKMFGTEKVCADWFTGKIVIPQGNEVFYIHSGYTALYEIEIHISIKKGIQTREKVFSNEKLFNKISNRIEFENQQQKIASILQDTLFQLVRKNIEWDTTKTPCYDLCGKKYLLTYNRKGKLQKVWVDWKGYTFSQTFSEKINHWWWNMTSDRKCKRKIKKALKPLNISILSLTKQKIEVPFNIFYSCKTGELELWKEFWMKYE